MEVWHHVTFSRLDEVDSTLDEFLIKYKKSSLPSGHYILTFDINESDPRWPAIQRLIDEKGAVNIVDTEFTETEILAASCARLLPVFQRGYPQPERGWEAETYLGECPKCGIGYTQVAPFRLAGEPKMGLNDFLSLYWTYSLFCKQEIFGDLGSSGIKGYAVWPAIISKGGEHSTIVSQLVCPSLTKPGLAEEDKLKPESCSECGLTKYAYHKRGYMHYKREAVNPDIDIQQTYEWFGSGTKTGFREYLISNRFARLIIDRKWRGIKLKPVELY